MVFKFILPLIFCTSAYALPGYHEPWGKDSDLRLPQPPSPPPPRTPLSWTVEKIVRFHQTIISPVDGPRSHFRPSSSQYMLQAVQKHGLEGIFMGFDRLLRENSDEWVYRTTLYEGDLYKYDPPP